MIAGPIFHRELAIAPRRSRLYLLRSLYAAGLLMLISTAWLVLAGTQIIRSVGDMARFGTIMFQLIAPLQVALMMFFAAMAAASAVAQEKDRRTLILLLMTRMSNGELVLGKLLASLLPVFVMIASSVPIFMLTVLFGGISFAQVGRVVAVTVTTSLMAGSLGTCLAYWREKTFQTLALTALVLCFWLAGWEAVASGILGPSWAGVACDRWAAGFSPLVAIRAAARPFLESETGGGFWGQTYYWFLATSLLWTFLLCGVAIARVRKWNPSRELRAAAREGTADPHTPIWGAAPGAAPETAERARAGHVDARLPTAQPAVATRTVWDNPVLWREFKTWAYGRKIIFIRVAYVTLSVLALVALQAILSAAPTPPGDVRDVIPSSAKPLAPLYFVSLVILNALAVTSITAERDGQALDLLLSTDLAPHEFLIGKLAGAFSVAGLMVVTPLLLTLFAWWLGAMHLENLLLLVGGLLVMDLFVAMLGVHCGMRYANSRTAIGVSLGTVFFLCLGVVACMLMMISFSDSFQIQLAPFLAFILGGGVGLYVALGANQPSKAIAVSSIIAPFATFYAITSFLLGHHMSVFLVISATFGFTTAAMLVPALYEFDFALDRTVAADE